MSHFTATSAEDFLVAMGQAFWQPVELLLVVCKHKYK